MKTILAAAACLALSGAAPAPPPAAALAKAVVGQPAPDFKIKLLDGSKVSLAELRGKVVIINLWATWCGPCKVEMPGLDLMQVNGGKHRLQIIGVLVRDPTRAAGLRKLAKVLHYPLSMWINPVYKPIDGAVPTNYIIDRKGILRYARAASLQPEEFAELIVPLLNEPG